MAKEKGLPEILLEFYGYCNGCFIGSGDELIAPNSKFYSIRIPPISEIITVQEYGYIESDSPFYEQSKSWWQIIDNGSANWLAIDSTKLGKGRILDIPHEEVGYEGCHAIVSNSFEKLLILLIKYDGKDWFGISEWNELGWV